jgi:signal transduction histidine kinase
VNICSLAQALAHRALPKAAEKSITLECSTPPRPVLVEIDEEKISWVILQLLDNAIKFTPNEGQVDLEVTLDGPFVRVAVKDTGVGIPMERIDEVFEAFVQLDGSTTRRFGGTGLGLTLARRIIDSHGSSIQVVSEVGKGSQFVFLLKAAGTQKEGG